MCNVFSPPPPPPLPPTDTAGLYNLRFEAVCQSSYRHVKVLIISSKRADEYHKRPKYHQTHDQSSRVYTVRMALR